MFVKNLTPKTQVLNVQELLSPSREYCIYLEPNSRTELVGVFVTNKKALDGLVEFEKKVIASEPIHVREEKSEDTTVEENPENVEDISETVEVLEDKFICEQCGAEFASARGLASHKSRVHDNQ